jgi:hypothetical protein
MKTVLTFVIAGLMLVARADAQAPSTTNAALRYWMAFAVMKDPPTDQATMQLFDRVAAGTSAWDEAKLGKYVDENREALQIMRRATRLTTCDWGLEYELGPATPIAHLAKARVLGRLNGADAARLAARGQVAAAVDVWLAGIRFSQHVAKDGTLISLLSARLSLSPALESLARVVSQSPVDAAHRREIEATLNMMPQAGFDWADAMKREADVLAMAKRLDPKVTAPMPSQAKLNETAAEVAAEVAAVRASLASAARRDR